MKKTGKIFVNFKMTIENIHKIIYYIIRVENNGFAMIWRSE